MFMNDQHVRHSSKRRMTAGLVGLGLALVFGATGVRDSSAGLQAELDEAFRWFWAAYTTEQFDRAISGILATTPELEAVLVRLRTGRPYNATVPKGRHVSGHRNRDGVEHLYVVHVPAEYDPAKKYPVRMYLHGGVRRARLTDGLWWRDDSRFARPDTIVVFPAAWAGSVWWQRSQIESLTGILNDLKHPYNIDENRVFLLGRSDGASGAFYQALKAPTQWAAFLPFNGHPLVLANEDVEGQMYVPNLRNKPLLVINGGRDGRYPADSLAPLIRLFVEAGVSVDFRPQPEAGHDLSWFPQESASIDRFVDTTPRRPLPDRLVWQTERTDHFNRVHWLVITELGSVPGEAAFNDFNILVSDAQGEPRDLFPHTFPSGRVELERRGNVVVVMTRGVKKFKLLLSPDQFDLSEPIRVTINGVTTFEGHAPQNNETLLQWAAMDQDRTLLFTAELDLNVRGQ